MTTPSFAEPQGESAATGVERQRPDATFAIFISHSTKPIKKTEGDAANDGAETRTPAEQALDLAVATVREQCGNDVVFFDRITLREGDNFGSRIMHALGTARLAIILISHEALHISSWVHFEAGVMFWRQQFDDGIKLMYVLIEGVDPKDCYRLFSPHKVEDYHYFQFKQSNKEEFRQKLRAFLGENIAAVQSLTDPVYRDVLSYVEDSGPNAARDFLEQYDKVSLPETKMTWPDPVHGTAVVLVSSPVDMRTIDAFEALARNARRPEPAVRRLADHLKDQTTPIEYVSRLRSLLFEPGTGSFRRAPTVSWLSGTSTNLLKYRLRRVFGKNLYRWHLVPSQQDLLSADVLAQILLREKPRVGQQSLLADIKDTTTKPYVVAVRSDCDLESELYDYWITEFAGLPAHLFVLGAADRRPELGKREINEVRYLDASDEDLQTKWIDKIDIALEYSIGTG